MIGMRSVWLIELSQEWAMRPEQSKDQLALVIPSAYKPPRIRMAWVGPESVDNVSMARRLKAIGALYGADIVHVLPNGGAGLRASIAGHCSLCTPLLLDGSSRDT